MQQVVYGVDRFMEQAAKYKQLKFGLITNNAATTSTNEASRLALLKKGINVVRLFSPEHGLSAKGEDGSFQKNFTDEVTGLPVISLYGEKLKPTAEDLKELDALLFDIPDAGCRYYTYLWTLSYAMEAAAENQKQFIVLDRPNPAGGKLSFAEGPMLDEANCSSFIGRWNIPVRHCCTLGELAQYFAATKIKNADLQIIKTANWRRAEEPDLMQKKFIAPSPALTDAETILLYSGLGFLEGITINEGRGTATPFKILGAPWIYENELHDAFTSLNLEGVQSAPIKFIPASGLYTQIACKGIHLTVTDSEKFTPVASGLQILQLLISLYPVDCKERLYPTVANPTGANHLDRLTGVRNSFEKLKSGNFFYEKFWDCRQWEIVMKPYLLY
ncbi:MAG: hypothetical protein BWZ05_00132 [Bacteroidetes bacterium ADurb.BinA245]|nr:MAG: hypothetical protein BWZ05_00132 [Bacteroidetes bacterium ADurb.BinA245]